MEQIRNYEKYYQKFAFFSILWHQFKGYSYYKLFAKKYDRTPSCHIFGFGKYSRKRQKKEHPA